MGLEPDVGADFQEIRQLAVGAQVLLLCQPDRGQLGELPLIVDRIPNLGQGPDNSLRRLGIGLSFGGGRRRAGPQGAQHPPEDRARHEIAADDAARARLFGLERALAIEQRELRLFIGGLKPVASGHPAPDSLACRLDALRERLALEWNTPVSIRVSPESQDCPTDLAQAVPLMVHEAVVNALKHAQPTRVNVNVDGASDRLRIVVSDDGHGFPFKGTYDHRALGAARTVPRSLFDRVSALGGKMSIESSDAGSRIEMVVTL